MVYFNFSFFYLIWTTKEFTINLLIEQEKKIEFMEKAHTTRGIILFQGVWEEKEELHSGKLIQIS